MYIHEAAEKALSELGRPCHVSVIYRHIVHHSYYSFGAQAPENALAIQLSRRSSNVDIDYSSPDKRFYRAGPATYGLNEWLLSRDAQSKSILPFEEVSDDLRGILQDEELSTTKEQLLLARVGQGQFRQGVLEMWSDCCCVTGSRLAVRASHIKPWRSCSDEERLDVNNGLPLVATLDALFDAHLISFDISGRIIISSQIPEHEQNCLGITGDMRLRNSLSEVAELYMQTHREQFVH